MHKCVGCAGVRKVFALVVYCRNRRYWGKQNLRVKVKEQNFHFCECLFAHSLANTGNSLSLLRLLIGAQGHFCAALWLCAPQWWGCSRS